MSFAHAGLYSEALLGPRGAPQPNVAVHVYLKGTTTHAALYTDRTKATGAANPATTDTLGNLLFYADPGIYDLAANGGTVTVEVQVDQADVPSTANFQPLDADLTTIASVDSSQSGIIASDGSGWFRKTYAAVKTALATALSDLVDTNVGGVTDGQVLVWNAGTGRWVPTAQAGNAEAFHVETTSGSVTPNTTGGAGARADVPGAVWSNLNGNGRPLWIAVRFEAEQTVGVQSGILWVQIVDTTGAATDIGPAVPINLPKTVTNPDRKFQAYAVARVAGWTGSTKSFKAQTYCHTQAGVSTTVTVQPSSTTPCYFDGWWL